MQVDIRSVPSQPVAKIVEFAQKCEEAGLSGCGFNDSQNIFRDTYVVMATVLANTKRLRVHPALTCPGPRHTSIVASSAKTVQEFGPDRFELWLGRGNTAMTAVGMSRLTIKEMRDAVTKIKRYMAGEWDVYTPLKGTAEHVRMHHGGGLPVPVYIAAGGPIMQRMAGELADGVLMSVLLTKEGLAQGRARIAEGAARVKRNPSEVHEVIQMRCLIRPTKREAVRAWSPNLLSILAGPNTEKWLQERAIQYNIASLKPKFRAAEHEMHNLYPDAHHAQDWPAAEKLAEAIPYELQEAMGDTMAVLGDPDQVTRRILELESWGVNHIYLYPVETFRFPEPEVKAFREVVGPALKKAGTQKASQPKQAARAGAGDGSTSRPR